MSLSRAITLPSQNSIFILRDAVYKRLQVNERARTDCKKPCVKVLTCPRAHHLNKLLIRASHKLDNDDKVG